MNFIIFDLEATCWENQHHSQVQEIIEIGALKLDRYGDVKGEFERFVKPICHPSLSVFCKQLTSIEQKDVDNAKKFPKVLDDFLEWIGYYDDEEYLLCSWGDFDRKALVQDCELHRLEHNWTDEHICLRNQYHELKGLRKRQGLKRTVLNEGFEFTGIQHRGFSDALNLAKVFAKYLDVWQY